MGFFGILEEIKIVFELSNTIYCTFQTISEQRARAAAGQYKIDPLKSHSGEQAYPINDLDDIVAPLDSVTKHLFENAFGADLSTVRIHTGKKANQMARNNNADAVTIGADIYFADSKYSPASEDGEKLLAHELQHVVQGLRGERLVYLEDFNELEAEAERVGEIIGGNSIYGMDSLGLRQDNNISGGTAFHREQDKGLFKKPGSANTDMLDDFTSSVKDQTIIIILKSGDEVSLTLNQYRELIEMSEAEIKTWLDEECAIRSERDKDELLMEFLKWVKGGVSI